MQILHRVIMTATCPIKYFLITSTFDTVFFLKLSLNFVDSNVTEPKSIKTLDYIYILSKTLYSLSVTCSTYFTSKAMLISLRLIVN